MLIMNTGVLSFFVVAVGEYIVILCRLSVDQFLSMAIFAQKYFTR